MSDKRVRTYQGMNDKIVSIMRMSDDPPDLYAAQRIEELEAEVKLLKEQPSSHVLVIRCKVCGAVFYATSQPTYYDLLDVVMYARRGHNVELASCATIENCECFALEMAK